MEELKSFYSNDNRLQYKHSYVSNSSTLLIGNKLYVKGDNTWGQLGLGHRESVSKWKALNFGARIDNIIIGWSFILIVSAGVIYYSGSFAKRKRSSFFTSYTALSSITTVIKGSGSIFAIASGQLYEISAGCHEELKRLPVNFTVKTIFCKSNCLAIVGTRGEVATYNCAELLEVNLLSLKTDELLRLLSAGNVPVKTRLDKAFILMQETAFMKMFYNVNSSDYIRKLATYLMQKKQVYELFNKHSYLTTNFIRSMLIERGDSKLFESFTVEYELGLIDQIIAYLRAPLENRYLATYFPALTVASIVDIQDGRNQYPESSFVERLSYIDCKGNFISKGSQVDFIAAKIIKVKNGYMLDSQLNLYKEGKLLEQIATSCAKLDIFALETGEIIHYTNGVLSKLNTTLKAVSICYGRASINPFPGEEKAHIFVLDDMGRVFEMRRVRNKLELVATVIA